MNGFQWTVISLCFTISLIDGFDVLVMAFTASAVADDWSLGGVVLGYLLSAAPIGMTLGSLFIAPLADRWGRRPLIMGCLAIVGTAMTSSAYAPGPWELGLLRFTTGLGIGGLIASSYVIAGEFASRRWRGLAIGLQSAAFALGAVAGGLIAIQLIPNSGWRAVFFYGGLATLSMLPVVTIWFPESIDFLLSGRSTPSLHRINRLLRRLGLPLLERLPSPPRTVKASTAHPGKLLVSGLRTSTLSVWAAFFLAFLGFYFIFSWTPRLLSTLGLSGSQAIAGGVLLNVGGVLGAATLGLLAARYRLANLLVICMLATAALMALFSALPASSYFFASIIVLMIGFCANGTIAGLFALTPTFYRSSERVTGLGWAVGVGRLGAILAPTVTGALVAANWSPGSLFLLFSAFFAIAAMLIAFMNSRNAGKPAASALPEPLVVVRPSTEASVPGR